jgi:hypothetical protein
LPQNFQAGITRYLLEGPVYGYDRSIGIHDHDPILDGVNDGFPVFIQVAGVHTKALVKILDIGVVQFFNT